MVWFTRRIAERFSIGIGFSLLAARAAAQAPPARDGSAEAVSLPELIEGSPAPYPAAARAERLAGTVVLRLTIDVEGRVTDVQVAESAAPVLDDAARAAAPGLRFKPATRGGRPVPARLLYAYEFEPEPEPPPAAETGRVEGRVSIDGAAARDLEVAISGGAGQVFRATTDAAGRFRVEGLPPGSYSVTVTANGVTSEAAAEVSADTAASVVLTLVSPSSVPPVEPVEVTVLGKENEVQRLQHSAEAVNVVDTRRAQTQTADLGEVLARTQGVAVRRDGGLGSSARFSLNGLYDDQIRFSLDGVPLELTGYPFGVENVPVNLVERVEVYRGVVPIRFGADALGGAVNLVSDANYRTYLGASYQVGSFGTHRITLEGRHRHDPTGVVAGAAAYLDTAQNNYEVDVEVPDARGRLHPATVPRFHDAYHAAGATMEAGVVDRPWARRLILQGFVAGYTKEQQHNAVMTVPYGEVGYGEAVTGATARYQVSLLANVDLDVVGNFTRRRIDFEDHSAFVYDWFGRRIRPRRVHGEIEADPRDQSTWQKSLFGRVVLEWRPAPDHAVRLASSATSTTRTGDERLQADPRARDPLTAKRDLFTLVSGVEYELSLFDGRLSNIVFVKDYLYRADSEEPLPGNIFRERDRDNHSYGVGDALRFRFARWFYAKASYEYATRLPRPDEVFGDGVLVLANLELEPEVSHNANVGPRIELRDTGLGDFTVDVNGFLRDSDRLVVLLGNDRFFSYQNVYRALGLGVENAVEWSAPGHWLNLEGTLTWQDVRNASSEGTFGAFEGDRIPNRPYLLGSWGARLRFVRLPKLDDAVEPFYHGRYVHDFFRGWESQGLRQFKQVVEAQVTHDLGVSWTVNGDLARVTSTFEIDNVTNAKVFDNFGVQRPGRAYYLKLTGEL